MQKTTDEIVAKLKETKQDEKHKNHPLLEEFSRNVQATEDIVKEFEKDNAKFQSEVEQTEEEMTYLERQ
jgi:hypothetical protein